MRFELSAVPTAQQRTRHAKNGRAYKSAEQEANERTLEALLLPYKPQMPLRGPVTLDFTACMPIPSSVSKRRKEAMLRGEIGHTVRPDVDNLAKQLLDAMTRMGFWEDDKQVVELAGRKRYDATPRWLVEVRGND